MGYDGLGFRKGIPIGLTNSGVITSFLSELILHGQYGDMVREVDVQKYLMSTANYLSQHGVKIDEKTASGELELRLEEGQDQTTIDQANRIIILAKKIFLTTRENSTPSQNINGVEHNPQDYLDAILGAMNPLAGEEIIQYGDRISRELTIDKARNFIPTIMVDGFNALTQWYTSQKEIVERGKNKRKGGYKSIKELDSTYKQRLSRILEITSKYTREKGSFDLGPEGRAKFGSIMMGEIQKAINIGNTE